MTAAAQRHHLGAMLFAYRQKRDVTVAQLASEIGVPRATLSNLERGASMSLPTFFTLWAWLLQPAAPAAAQAQLPVGE